MPSFPLLLAMRVRVHSLLTEALRHSALLLQVVVQTRFLFTAMALFGKSAKSKLS
jgi:hypothetical protein